MFRNLKSESGYLLYVVLLLLGVAGLLIASSLERSRASLKIVATIEQYSKKYSEAESGLHQALSWMRMNSQKLASPFRAESFYEEFERTSPSVGDNDTANFTLPTRIKLRGTSDSAILTNDATLATSTFANAVNLVSGSSWNAVSSFNSLSTGAAIRITLIDATGRIPARDYGDTFLGNDTPDTGFNPVYRIDSYSSTAGAGVHLYAIVTGTAFTSFDPAIYGENLVRSDVDCDSYNSGLGAYGGGNKAANCAVYLTTNSADRFNWDAAKTVYGTLTASDANVIDATSPYGGEICADFVSGCPNPGVVCASADCPYFSNIAYDTWPTYCPSDQGNLTIAADQTLTPLSAAPTDNCWATVTINAGVTLTLDSVDYPYHFNNLVFADETSSQLQAAPATAGKSVVLYVNDMATDLQDDTMSLVTASTGVPGDFRMIYFGNQQSYLRKSSAGTFSAYLSLISPNYPLSVEGNVDFYGAIFAESVSLLQNAGHAFHYDEALAGSGPVVDMRFKMESVAEYRD